MHMLSRLIASHPIRLLLTIALAFLLCNFMPITLKQFFLAVSLLLKEILMLMIPLIIFSSVYGAFSKMKGNAFSFVILLLICVVLSNFFSVTIAGIFSYFLVFTNETIVHRPHEVIGLTPLWEFTIPKLVSNNVVLLSTFILSYVTQPILKSNINKVARMTSKIVDIFLKKLFIPLLPIFIFGFLIKLLSDNIIGDVLAVNPKAFLFMIIILLSYLFIIFMSAVVFYKKKPKGILRNLAAPTITAFTCMSSAAALPFSIKAAEENTKNKSLSDVVMPATVNIHMIGDSICIPILAMILLMAFGYPMPSISSYFLFAVFFVITKFSGAGVPGGSVLVMIPVLEKYLGLNSDMIALITICYMLLDPICTSSNVIGNNLFVIHFNKLYSFFKKNKERILFSNK